MKTKEFKTLEDLIAYDGSDIPDKGYRAIARIKVNLAAIEILMLRTDKLLKEHEKLCRK